MRVQGFGVQGAGFRVQGFRVQGFRVQGSGFRDQGCAFSRGSVPRMRRHGVQEGFRSTRAEPFNQYIPSLMCVIVQAVSEHNSLLQV